MHDLDIVILAAGKGTRMQSDLPKVLHTIVGKPLIQLVLETALQLKPHKIYVIVGHGAEAVIETCKPYECQPILQKEQLGTGHALRQALPYLRSQGRTLVLYGDVPLIKVETLKNFIENTPKDALGLLTAVIQDPTGLGRIVRDDPMGSIIKIVEEKDASSLETQLKEINTGIYILPNHKLESWLSKINNANRQKEYYLTDVITLAVQQKVVIHDWQLNNESEIRGINTRSQLNLAQREYLTRRAYALIEAGVDVFDPHRLDIRGEFSAQPGTQIDINLVTEGNVTLGANVSIGPNCYLRDCTIADNVKILANSMIEESSVGESAQIGPFARVRPGSDIGVGAHIGNFVELKKTRLGAGSKASHLTYLGDAVIGKGVNIGAGTITCNYNGVSKSTTEIDDGAFIGSNTSLIAPVKIEKDALIGAGSVITQTAPANRITLSRAKQVTVGRELPKYLKAQKPTEPKEEK